MYELSVNNRFYRIFAITTDAYGIDPLMDRVVPRILTIPSYRNHEVTQDERGQPDLISFREYASEDYWWHIMVYNGICRFRSVVEGTTLKIPDLGALVSVTNDAMSEMDSSAGDNIITI